MDAGDDHWTSFGWNDRGWDEHGIDRGWDRLDGASCARLVASSTVGRVALTHRALPLVLPVEIGDMATPLRFQVHEGALLNAARDAQVVCFETDSGGVDVGAWSVVIVGHLSVRTEPIDGAYDGEVTIELLAEIVTGRLRVATQS